MSKLSGWKVVCLAVAVVALSLSAAKFVRADSFSEQAAKLDILGVHLGMTPAQAKSALAQYRKDMRWNEVKGDLGIQEGQFLAYASEQSAIGDVVSIVFSPPPGDPNVLAIDRTLSFGRSHAPTAENLTNSLSGKFGQPSYNSHNGEGYQEFVWSWDKTGQISKANGSIIDQTYSEVESTPSSSNSSSRIQTLQQDNDPGCAIAVQAVIYSNNGVASQLRMKLFDVHDALRAAIAADNYVKQVEQARKEGELKKAGANKPSL
ncbi:MAG: hypothetical protein WA993_09545 [Candidatus Binatus sp.]|jgi:hypothetical protein